MYILRWAFLTFITFIRRVSMNYSGKVLQYWHLTNFGRVAMVYRFSKRTRRNNIVEDFTVWLMLFPDTNYWIFCLRWSVIRQSIAVEILNSLQPSHRVPNYCIIHIICALYLVQWHIPIQISEWYGKQKLLMTLTRVWACSMLKLASSGREIMLLPSSSDEKSSSSLWANTQ